MTLCIPRLMHQIWIGPKPKPLMWMKTWPQHHPDWLYVEWTNQELYARKWMLQHAIDHYKSKSQWAGVADCMRYEILYEYGGFMPGADSVCERRVDELFEGPQRNVNAWAVYENEEVVPGWLTPVYAAKRGSMFCRQMIEQIEMMNDFQEPWISVGNKKMADVARYWGDGLATWPSWYFNPEHHSGVFYQGDGVPYGRQMWGSTKRLYR